jgi:hypothetical protein
MYKTSLVSITFISTPFHHQRNNNLFVSALHLSTTMGQLQVLQILCITITKLQCLHLHVCVQDNLKFCYKLGIACYRED